MNKKEVTNVQQEVLKAMINTSVMTSGEFCLSLHYLLAEMHKGVQKTPRSLHYHLLVYVACRGNAKSKCSIHENADTRFLFIPTLFHFKTDHRCLFISTYC